MRDNRRSDDRLEELMKAALTSNMEPDEEVNRRILRKWKENLAMRKQRRKTLQIAAVAVACVMLTGVTVGATVRYMNAAEAADAMGNEEIAEAFRGEDAVSIDEVQEWGDYRVTLLGITTGEKLIHSDLSEDFTPDSTYAAVAIERLDGTAMPSTSDDAYGEMSFFVSPLIQGLTPWQYNIASMNGGYSDIVDNGILYRIIECDDVMMFADRTIYLCVSNTTFYENAAYNYDEATGLISQNVGYDGMNLLFTLPFDASRADSAAAEAYLQAIEESWSADSVDDENAGGEDGETSDMAAAEAEADRILEAVSEGKKEEAVNGANLLDTETLVLSDGHYEYDYGTADEDGESDGICYFYPEDFVNGFDAMICYNFDNEGAVKGLTIMLVQDNGDNTAVLEVWEKEITAQQ